MVKHRLRIKRIINHINIGDNNYDNDSKKQSELDSKYL